VETLSSDWIDVSVPLRTGRVHWPDNPPVRIERLQDMERGDSANVSVFSLGSHTGTHMDARCISSEQGLASYVEDTGEVNWLVGDALWMEVSIPVISQAVMRLILSRDNRKIGHGPSP